MKVFASASGKLVKQLSGHTLLPSRLLEIIPKLIFQKSVDSFDLLFFTELKTITNDLGFSSLPMLAGREISFLDGARVLKAAIPFEK